MLELAEYNIEIHHVKGSANGRADALSRRADYDQGTGDNQDMVVLPDKLFIRATTTITAPQHRVKASYGHGSTPTSYAESTGCGIKMEEGSTQVELPKHATLSKDTTTHQYTDTLESPGPYSSSNEWDGGQTYERRWPST